jgi:hypothetical protein
VLTDCPPGPEDRLKRHRSSRSGTTTDRVTRRGPATREVCIEGEGDTSGRVEIAVPALAAKRRVAELMSALQAAHVDASGRPGVCERLRPWRPTRWTRHASGRGGPRRGFRSRRVGASLSFITHPVRSSGYRCRSAYGTDVGPNADAEWATPAG